MLSNLKKEIFNASEQKGVVVGFNVFGFEDSKAVLKAAERLNYPTALMINKLAIQNLPIESWAGLLLPLAEQANIPVSLHLDHCQDFKTIMTAIHSGFTSVMFDGSQLPIDENIRLTKEVVKVASCFDVSVEGEIGSVPYADIPGAAKDAATDPNEAKKFAEQSGIDWMAIAVGQVHRLTGKTARIHFDRLKEISDCTNVPLVIHGGSGIDKRDLDDLIKGRVAKINFGTGLRIAFGETLKKSVAENPQQYDRLVLFENSVKAVEQEAFNIISKVKVGNLI